MRRWAGNLFGFGAAGLVAVLAATLPAASEQTVSEAPGAAQSDPKPAIVPPLIRSKPATPKLEIDTPAPSETQKIRSAGAPSVKTAKPKAAAKPSTAPIKTGSTTGKAAPPRPKSR